MIFAQPIKPDALWKAAGHNSGLSEPSNWHPPVSREQPGGRACPSWRVWGARFPLLPGRFRCVRGRAPDRVRAWGGGPAPRAGRALARAAGPGASAPCSSLPALAPARRSSGGLTSSGSRALEQLCLQTSPGRAGVRPRPAGARPP